MPKQVYAAPTIYAVGSFHELTLVGSNKYSTLSPDGITFHPSSGPPIALTS